MRSTRNLPRSDRALALGVAFGFSLALGIATVTIPLVALGAGYDPAAVGFLVATSSASQLATRLTLPQLLGRFPDRVLIGFAAALMAAAFLVLLASTVLPAFVAAQLSMGAARAFSGRRARPTPSAVAAIPSGAWSTSISPATPAR